MFDKDQITEYVLSNTREMMSHGHETPDRILLDKSLRDLDIDSLEFMEFLMNSEDEYNIKFKDTEIETMSSPSMVVDLIYKKIKK